MRGESMNVWRQISPRRRQNKTSVSPSASQPLFFASAVYEDLSTRHDWPFKKAIVSLANQVESTFETLFRSFGGPVQGSRRCWRSLSRADVPKASSCVLIPRKEGVSPPSLHVRGKRTVDEALRTSAFEAIADVSNRVKNINLRGRVTTNPLNITLVLWTWNWWTLLSCGCR